MIDRDEVDVLRRDVQMLKDINAIQSLKYRYLECIDTGNVAELRTLLHDDLTTDFRGGHFHLTMSGADDFVTFLERTLHTRFIAIHLAHHPQIHIDSDTEAHGTWYLWDDDRDLQTGARIYGTAIYEDRYEKVAGRWLIRHTGYSRVFHANEALSEMEVTVHVLAEHGYEYRADETPVPLGVKVDTRTSLEE